MASNKYPTTCKDCGQVIPAGEGRLAGKVDGRWTALHVPECPADAEAPVPAADFEPTQEQDDALYLFTRGKSFLIEAGAGTGKTATLKLLAESTRQRRGAYMAFNRKIVEDFATVAPRSVAAKTVHAWAFAAEGRRFKHRFDSSRQQAYQVASHLRIGPLHLQIEGDGDRTLSPAFLAAQVMRAAKIFCNSEASAPGVEHFAYIDGIDLPDVDGNRTYKNNQLVRKALLPALQAAWKDLQDENGQLRYIQDAYVKVFALGEAKIAADYILVDEAQDLSGVMVTILRKARARGQQVVCVGDPAQTIYTWRGSVSLFDAAYAELFEGHTVLTQAFRFGQTIADVANSLLEKAEAKIRLVGNPERESTVGVVGQHDALVTRTNAYAVAEFLGLIAEDRKPHLVGGGDEVARFCKGAIDLQRTGHTNHPELACFSSWNEVQIFVTSDPEGEDLKLLVKLIDQFGADKILAGLQQMVAAKDADLVIATAHKSKGLQWDKVRLGSDFADPGTRGNAQEEWRVLYVAATRAKFHLDYSGCQPVADLFGGHGQGAEL